MSRKDDRQCELAARRAVVLTLTLAIACSSMTPVSDADGDADRDGNAPSDGDIDTGACVHPVCDTWPPCGCPDGSTCIEFPYRYCLDDANNRHGWTCIFGYNDCGDGFDCLDPGFGLDEEGMCFQYCDEDTDCIAYGAGSVCEPLRDHPEDGPHCTVACDPTDAMSCIGVQCFLFFREHDASLPYGLQCEGGYACELGFTLVIDVDGPHCLRICSENQPDCPEGSTCVLTDERLRLGSVQYGFCDP